MADTPAAGGGSTTSTATPLALVMAPPLGSPAGDWNLVVALPSATRDVDNKGTGLEDDAECKHGCVVRSLFDELADEATPVSEADISIRISTSATPSTHTYSLQEQSFAVLMPSLLEYVILCSAMCRRITAHNRYLRAVSDIVACSAVCKAWRHWAQSDGFWTTYHKRWALEGLQNSLALDSWAPVPADYGETLYQLVQKVAIRLQVTPQEAIEQPMRFTIVQAVDTEVNDGPEVHISEADWRKLRRQLQDIFGPPDYDDDLDGQSLFVDARGGGGGGGDDDDDDDEPIVMRGVIALGNVDSASVLVVATSVRLEPPTATGITHFHLVLTRTVAKALLTELLNLQTVCTFHQRLPSLVPETAFEPKWSSFTGCSLAAFKRLLDDPQNFEVEEPVNNPFSKLVAPEGCFKGLDRAFNKPVWILRLQRELHDEGFDQNRLCQFAVLSELRHPHIASARAIVTTPQFNYLITDWAEVRLIGLQCPDNPVDLLRTEQHVKLIAFQLLSALACLHAHGFVHRHLKMVQVRLSSEGQVKLIGFTRAHSVAGSSADHRLDDWVSNPGYSPPELLLGQSNCAIAPAADVWAAACIIAELGHLGHLNFMSSDCQFDHLVLCCRLCGTPPADHPLFQTMPRSHTGFDMSQLPQYKPMQLSEWRECLPTFSDDLILLLQKMMRFDPHTRLSASAALSDPVFDDVRHISSLCELERKLDGDCTFIAEHECSLCRQGTLSRGTSTSLNELRMRPGVASIPL